MSAPSPFQLQAVMSIAQAAASRLQADGVLDEDGAALFAECPDAGTMLVRVLRAMDEAKRNAEAIDKRIADLEARRDREIRRHGECRATAFAILEVLGLTKWKHPEFTVSVSPGRAGVVITDEAALPEEFLRVTTSPDKAKIKAALEMGQVVLGATLQNTMPTLTVRTK